MKPEAPVERAPAVRVLYVAGAGRSGSTLVANILGSTPGLLSVGELRYLWERGLGESALCGCGQPVPTCPFWSDVLQRAYGDERPDVEAILRADRHLLRVRGLTRLIRAHGHPSRLGHTAAWYAGELQRVYEAIAAVAPGTVVVDSSKLVGFGYLLSAIDGLDVRVLHLVRDARGVAHSWSLDRARDDRGTGPSRMGRERVTTSAVLWDVHNASAEALLRKADRYVRVRYEDVVADPADTLRPALRLLGIESDAVPPAAAGLIHLSPSHTVAGNPNRMLSGVTRISVDLSWRSSMPLRQRVLVTALCGPQLRRYGYRLRPHRPAPATDGARVFVEDMRGPRRFVARARRNLGWAREQGLGRVLEEKEIDPLRTIPVAIGKSRYRHRRNRPGQGAVPVFLVGLQRSGTNMIVRGLGAAPEVEVHNEDDRRAFERYKLRSNDVIESLVAGSRHSYVLFKPLCDSHRVAELLDGLHTDEASRAVWAYRDVDGRVRSALAKFGDGNLQVLREYASGANTSRWHVQGMSGETADLVRSFDYDTLGPASGAALMWLVRNRLYFDLHLDEREDAHLVSYNAFLTDPEGTMRTLCTFLGFPYRESLTKHVTARTPTYREPLDIDPLIRRHCDDLTARLDAAAARAHQARRFRIASER